MYLGIVPWGGRIGAGHLTAQGPQPPALRRLAQQLPDGHASPEALETLSWCVGDAPEMYYKEGESWARSPTAKAGGSTEHERPRPAASPPHRPLPLPRGLHLVDVGPLPDGPV